MATWNLLILCFSIIHVTLSEGLDELTPPSCFEFDRHYLGSQIGDLIHPVENADKCQTLCREEESCIRFNWRELENVCELLSSQGPPKDVIGEWDGKHVTGLKYCPSSGVQSCFETDKAYIGYGLKFNVGGTDKKKKYFEGSPSPQHCQMLCQQHPYCQWFNWLNTTNDKQWESSSRCYLKEGKGKSDSSRKRLGVTTGPKYCQPTQRHQCIKRGLIYIGDGLNYWKKKRNNFGRQKTEQACQMKCEHTNGCKWFNWNKDSKCYLKRSHGQGRDKKRYRKKAINSEGRLEAGSSTGPRVCPYMPKTEGCEAGWEYFQGMCYYLNLRRGIGKKYLEAKETCEQMRSSLLTIQSAEEFVFLTDYLNRLYFQWKGLEVWVGAKGMEGKFTWEDDNNSSVSDDWWQDNERPHEETELQLIRDNSEWVFQTELPGTEESDGTFICEKKADLYGWRPNLTTESSKSVSEEKDSYSCSGRSDCLGFLGYGRPYSARENSYLYRVECRIPKFPEPLKPRGAATVVDDHILACAEGKNEKDSKCYSLIDGQWKKEASMNDVLDHFRMSPTSKGALRTGGIASSQIAVNTTEYFSSGKWIAGPPLPTPQSGHCQVTMGNTVYVAGGETNGHQLHALDVEANTWRKMPDTIHERSGADCVEFQGKLWIIGGQSDTTEYFDPEKNQWFEGPKLPYKTTNEYDFLYVYNDNLFTTSTKLSLDQQKWTISHFRYGIQNYARDFLMQPQVVRPSLLNCKI